MREHGHETLRPFLAQGQVGVLQLVGLLEVGGAQSMLQPVRDSILGGDALQVGETGAQVGSVGGEVELYALELAVHGVHAADRHRLDVDADEEGC
jgi:hypothetical protein